MRSAILGVATTLLVAEVLLRVASPVARVVLSRSASPRTAERTTILCVGDSHTFGAPFPQTESYPAQLETRLAALFPGAGIRVVNLGVPGANSAFVANRLARAIVEYRPQIVIVWAGVNNIWNAAETEIWGGTHWRWNVHRALLRIRLYRLGAVLWQTQTARPVGAVDCRRCPSANAEFRLGGEWIRPSWRAVALDIPMRARGLAFDLERMSATARTHGVPMLLVNYPLPYDGVTETLAAEGARLGLPVIDTGRDLARAESDGLAEEQLIVWSAGPHPTPVLYRYIVESITPVVVDLLAQRGAVSREVLPPRAAGEPAGLAITPGSNEDRPRSAR